jgi:L-ascorbate metabolism protein UlaG (beta-lactamase superfamily)
MKIKYFGHAAFKITQEKYGVRIITEPYEPNSYDGAIGYSEIEDEAEIVTVSHTHPDHNNFIGITSKPEIIKTIGRVEKGGIILNGVETYHDTAKGANRGKNIVYTITADDITICHLGDLGHPLTEEQVKKIGSVDVLLIPVGGGPTIDKGAVDSVINALKPKIIIPMHYKSDKCSLNIAGLDQFLKGKKGIKHFKESEITIKKDSLPKETEIFVLSPSN